MDWIRRNWPDLLIGLALLAVIAGIIATLLNGGSFLSGGARTPTPSAASATTQPGVQPDTPADSVAANGATADPAATDSAAVDSVAVDGADPDAAPETQATAQDAGQDTGQDTVVPSIETTPLDGSPAADGTTPDTDVPVIPSSSGAADTEEATPAATTPAATATAPSTTATPTTTTAPATASAGATSGTVSNVESAYRIVVGSFGNADNAQRRAQDFADAGFPAFTATQGDLTLALVGPYDTQNEAESAFNRIQTEGLEAAPLLFAPAGATSDAAATETSDGAALTPATPDPATTQTPVDADVVSTDVVSGDYLQTGAYGSSASAQPQRERLEGLGFNVSEVTEGSFVKLLVGPFSADELAGAQSRLSAQGIDYFVRSN